MANYHRSGMTTAEVSIGGKYVYRRDCIIGHGSFAIVFRGRFRENPNRAVAVKCINQKNLSKTYSLLQKEIQILKELKHDNIVQLYDCYHDKSGLHLIMEFCNGGDLADYLSKKKTLTEPVIRLFLKQIAAALKLLHDKSIVHRDLKPQNILLAFETVSKSPQPEEIKVKVADFGFARHLEVDAMAATLCGSPMYMAPEVMTSQTYDSRADIWSLGTIIYQCLVGKAPFYAPNPQKLRAFYENTPVLQPNIPEVTSSSLKTLLLMMLRKDPEQRCRFLDFYSHPFLSDDTSCSIIPQNKRSASFLPTESGPYGMYSRTAPQTGRFLRTSSSPGSNCGSPNAQMYGTPGAIFGLGTSPPSPLVAAIQENRLSEESTTEESIAVTSSGESDQVVCHDDDDEFAKNMSSTITTSDLDTPEGFVLVPNNLDEFGRVMQASDSDKPPVENRMEDAKAEQQRNSSNNPVKGLFPAAQLTPPNSQFLVKGSVSPIDRHRIITDSQGVKFIIGSPPQSPAPSPTIQNPNAQNISPSLNRTGSLSSTKQLYYPQKRLSTEINSNQVVATGSPVLENRPKSSSERAHSNQYQRNLQAVELGPHLPRAVTFHQLSNDVQGLNTFDTALNSNQMANFGFSHNAGVSSPYRNLNNHPAFAYHRQDVYNTKIQTEPNLLALIPEYNFRVPGAQPTFTAGFSLNSQPRFWSQGIPNANVDMANLKAMVPRFGQTDRAVSTPNFSLAMNQNNFCCEKTSPIQSSPMRKLSSELLHIAYSPSPPHRKTSNVENQRSQTSRNNLSKTESGAPNLNIHEQLCDSNSDLANEAPVSVFSVSPSSRRRSLSSIVRGSFDGSDVDISAVPRDLSDVNILNDKERELAENLTLALSISQCLFKFSTTNNDILPGIVMDSASDYVKDRNWELDFPLEINNTTEKIMFLLRSLEVIRNCADLVKETQQETELSAKTKLILYQVHDTFNTSLCSLQKMCSEHPEYSNMSLSTDQLRNCANSIIYAQALQSCREAAFDEQSHCWRKAYYNYRNAQLLLSCLLLDTGIESDRIFITKIFHMVEFRLDCCLNQKISAQQDSSSV